MRAIKVYINRDLSKSIGPNIFVRRLINFMTDQGKIIQVKNKPDINFCIINTFNRKKGARTLLRIDGMYWNGHDKNGLKMNPQIFKSVRQADMVVFQSQFCRRCFDRYVGKYRRSMVIYNAINQEFINSVVRTKLGPEPQFVSIAKWRPTKRPNSICRGFIKSRVDGTLNMIGSLPKNPINNQRIRWLGNLSPKKVISILKGCNYAIHLAKFDPCPNSVIEELSCGLPVLHTDNGGTPEIVQKDGICLRVDSGWDYSTLYDEIDNLDEELVGQHIIKLSHCSKIKNRKDLDIKNAAQLYWTAFNKILNIK